MKKFASVEEYIDRAPEAMQPRLEQLRETIKAAVPEAEEKIGYGMPHYAYKGPVAYFLLASEHIGLYLPPPIVEEYEDELEGYETAKATIRFPLDQRLPLKLITKLVKARVKMNERDWKQKNS